MVLVSKTYGFAQQYIWFCYKINPENALFESVETPQITRILMVPRISRLSRNQEKPKLRPLTSLPAHDILGAL